MIDEDLPISVMRLNHRQLMSYHCCPVNLNTDVGNTMILEVQLRLAYYSDMNSQNNGSLLPQGEG